MADENQNNNQSWGDPAAMRANAEFAKSFSTDMEDSALFMKSMSDAMSSMAKKANINDKTMVSYLGAVKDVTKELLEQADLIENINKGEVSMSEAKELQKKAQEKIDKLNTKADRTRTSILSKEKAGTISKKQSANLLSKMLNTEKESLRLKENMSLAVSHTAKGSTKAAGAFGHMAKTFGAMGWAKASGASRAIAVGIRGAAIAGGGLALTVKWIGRALMKFAMSNPYVLLAVAILAALAAVKAFFKTLVKVNQEVTEIGRAFGVNHETAVAIRKEYVAMAASLSEQGIEYTHLLQAQGALQDSLGTSAKVISVDILHGMAMMTERMHLSAEAAVAFGKAALANKQTVRGLTLQVMDNVLTNQKNTGVMLQGKKIMEETAKVGGQLRGIYAANMDLISKSVIKAQMLGKSLGQVSKESKTMLDFQSSIEKEMEAELFLGRQLNLEKARLAALTGDYDTYMDEIVKNAGDFHEFSKLNVMQQDKMAAALGMSTDALADMLLQRADLEQLKEKARAEGREDLLKQYEQMSLNEQWLATTEKLKKMIINLVAGLEWLLGWIPGLFEGISDMSDATTLATHRAGTVETVGAADPMAYDKVEKYDSLGRKVAQQFYPKDTHWFSGTMPDKGSKNQNQDLKANINVTTRMSDMNYEGRTSWHNTKFNNQG